MATTINTGWRTVTPGPCTECGSDDEWQVDGRGNVMCGCQCCPDCGIVDAYGFHEPGCPTLAVDHEAEEDDPTTTLIAAERKATEGITLQSPWCLTCRGPLDVDDVSTCAGCRVSTVLREGQS